MKENLLILMGPTAIGKTDISIELAKNLSGEIISADSMQIYRYMDIGTAKVKDEEMKGIKHHMINIVNPDEDFSVQNFQKEAKKHIKTINAKNKYPILAGGTGLYINSLTYDLDFAGVAKDQNVRNKYENIAVESGREYLHSLLYDIDRESYININVNDVKRVVRALEIHELTGKTMTEYNKNFRKESTQYNLDMFCLNMDREKLYERINRRVDLMIQSGLIEEVKNILDMGYNKDLISLKAIGYKEIIMYLENEISFDKAVEMIKKGSRNYAKRQLTWFRRDKRIKWINIQDFKNEFEIANYIEAQIK